MLDDRRPGLTPRLGQLPHLLAASGERELRPAPAAVQVEDFENAVVVDEVEDRERLLEIDVEEPEVDLPGFTRRRIGGIREERTGRLLEGVGWPANMGRDEDRGGGDEVGRRPGDTRQGKRE